MEPYPGLNICGACARTDESALVLSVELTFVDMLDSEDSKFLTSLVLAEDLFLFPDLTKLPEEVPLSIEETGLIEETSLISSSCNKFSVETDPMNRDKCKFHFGTLLLPRRVYFGLLYYINRKPCIHSEGSHVNEETDDPMRSTLIRRPADTPAPQIRESLIANSFDFQEIFENADEKISKLSRNLCINWKPQLALSLALGLASLVLLAVTPTHQYQSSSSSQVTKIYIQSVMTPSVHLNQRLRLHKFTINNNLKT
ncbi:hypothetical protein PV328_001035 [Microctonus aethiopoides]|uniref:Uncharacterized protein n=1 Tax=Microctonus aethiopoides TaxID=144406 RepID=A0AA39KX55_9HYME|nr:hypothetical protein PV328_001035 [Microctonus aethiopoides]